MISSIAPTSTKPLPWLAEKSQGTMPRGSVIVHAPSHVFQTPGGGEAQVLQTSRHLDRLGVTVRPFQPWLDRLAEARLIHLFGMSREGLELARIARACGTPVVISPISWYQPSALVALARGRVRAGFSLAFWLLQSQIPRWPRWKRSLLLLASAMLPNSQAEADQLIRLFGVDPSRIHVVPNGVDDRFFGATPHAWQRRYGPDPFVLYSGRIEPRKNVLGLIRAARSTGFPLTILGTAPTEARGYFEECRRAGGDGVRWIPGLDHDDPLLPSAYAACRVLALPSWFETPGLAALEGGAAGAAVVITPFGSTREYFGDRAQYARPNRPREISEALETAWRRGADPGLASHIAENFTWTEVARRTAEVYDRVTG